MKKILFFTLMLMFIASNCFAMKFSQPVEIGWIGWSQRGGGFYCENSFYNDGNYKVEYYNNKKRIKGEKGIAGFGNNSNALYVHYDYNNVKKNHDDTVYIGGKNLNNTIPIKILNDWIYKIDSDSGITIYAIRFFYGPDSEFTIIGKKNDGTFIKYIDTRDISKKYFGINTEGGASPIVYNIPKSEGDTIIISYDNKNKKNGEFKFKWDEAAQWFSVEQIIY